MKTWPPKDPDEILDYGFDWSLRDLEGDTIVSFASTVVEGTVVVDDSTFSSASLKTITWLSGGVDGETCKILLRVTTTMGRTLEQTVSIKIKTR